MEAQGPIRAKTRSGSGQIAQAGKTLESRGMRYIKKGMYTMFVM